MEIFCQKYLQELGKGGITDSKFLKKNLYLKKT